MPDSVYCWDCGFQSPVQLYPQKDDLRGLYKKAFDKIWGVLEDSGWLLTQPGAEAGEVQMVCVPFPSYDHYASSDVHDKSIFMFLSLVSCKLCIFLTFLCIIQCLTKVFISSYHSSAGDFAHTFIMQSLHHSEDKCATELNFLCVTGG
jgi:hypothetical protein